MSFVSVTQQFNTTTSMGRLTLNALLSFAQFEREVTRTLAAHAKSSLRREALASRRAASRFERVRLQCRAPLDDGVIEQFEHQTKGR